jgi:6-phosphofructokinase 1
MSKKIGVLTAGSDTPGLNAAIRAIGKAGQSSGMQVIGFQDGFLGLLNDQVDTFEGSALSGILPAGGTILGTSRDQPHRFLKDGAAVDLTDQAAETYHRHKLDALVCIGGRETQESACRLMEKGLNVITLPKAIDNDLNLTELTIGFQSAVEVAAVSIDRLHSTAYSHHRIIIVEVMGRSVGWLTLGAGIAGGADVILIPEIPYNIQKVAEAVLQRNRSGKRFSIVAVTERVVSQEKVAFLERLRQINARLRSGAEREEVDVRLMDANSYADGAFNVANRLKELTGLETRMTILGYLLRGGLPSAEDRILATRLGTASIALIEAGQFGVMIAVRGGYLEPVPLVEAIWSHRPVPLDHPWIDSARRVGTHLGD